MKFFLTILIINLLIGSSLGYLLTSYPQPKIPDEFIDVGLEEQSRNSKIESDILETNLQFFESEVISVAKLLQEILLNRSIIPARTSYFHDVQAIVRENLASGLPGLIGSSQKHGIDISLGASAYHIAPNTYLEPFREQYLNTTTVNFEPLQAVSNSVAGEIQQTAKLDFILPDLYQSSPDNFWLYFGSEAGYTRSYPYSKISYNYDPRDESWYISAATGAKDVIVVLDKSGSMEKGRREGAINATKNIIRGLGGRDRFNILTFSDELDSYTDSLSLVTQETLPKVDQYLDSIITGGTTDYNLALDGAFKVLHQYGSQRRTPVVLFITDGKPTVGISDNNTLIENLVQNNGGINADVVMFGIGNQTDQTLLHQMATAVGGTYQQINSTAQIETAISNYNEFLSENRKASLTWSLPRTDVRTGKLVLTISYPVIVNKQLRGVVGLDISLSAMSGLVNSLKHKAESYSFVTDPAGTNIVHPTINLTTSTVNEIRQPIGNLEKTSDPIFASMISKSLLEISDTQLVAYDTGVQNIVSVNPIGNTSLIYGVVTPLSAFVPESVNQKLNTLEINPWSFLPGIALGIVTAIILVIFRKRLTREVDEDQVKQDEVPIKEESS